MIKEITDLAKRKGYVIYDQPYKLNIWGFRSPNATPNSFDDEIHVFTNISQTDRPKWLYLVFKATTDPGTFWLKNPMNTSGTAILNPAQYVDTYAIDLHRGKYKALCQRLAPVNITRDYNRNAILDFNLGKIVRGFGINIHRANRVGTTLTVDKHSAGCQVFKNESDFDFFMKLCELHRSFHGNKFTYTLVDERMEQVKSSLKTLAIGAALVALIVGGYFLITDDNEKDDAL